MSLNPIAFEWTNNSISPANVRALGNGTFLEHRTKKRIHDAPPFSARQG